MDRQKWGLFGLLAFEAIVAAYTLGRNTLTFSAMYAIAAIVLGLAIVMGPKRWHFAILAVVSAYRAFLQTSGGAQLGVYPTWLVPIGFAWLAVAPWSMPKLAIGAVALARTWFVLWYFLPGSYIIVAANIIGAAGAWLWLAADDAPDASARSGAAEA